jgi:hypothetical protein
MDQPTSISLNFPGHFSQPSMEVDSVPTTGHLPASGSTPLTLSSAAGGSSAPLVASTVPVPSMDVDTPILPSKRPSDNLMEDVTPQGPSMTTVTANVNDTQFSFKVPDPQWPDIGRRSNKRVAVTGPDQLELDNVCSFIIADFNVLNVTECRREQTTRI